MNQHSFYQQPSSYQHPSSEVENGKIQGDSENSQAEHLQGDTPSAAFVCHSHADGNGHEQF